MNARVARRGATLLAAVILVFPTLQSGSAGHSLTKGHAVSGTAVQASVTEITTTDDTPPLRASAVQGRGAPPGSDAGARAGGGLGSPLKYD